MNYFIFTLTAFISYLFNKSLSKNGCKINNKLPYIKIRFIQISPNVKILLKNRTIHIHHWLTYTIILVITLTVNFGYLESLFSNGFLIGGIIQGLSFSDWKKIIYPKVNNA